MAIVYATYSEFTQIYSIQNVSQAEINSTWIPEGALELNERLGTFFTTPFSSNNETARNLSIHLGFIAIQDRQRTRDQTTLRVVEKVERRISALVNKNSPMITTSGNPIYSDALQDGAFSTNEAYLPTFNMLDAECQRIDQPLLDDTARNINSRRGRND